MRLTYIHPITRARAAMPPDGAPKKPNYNVKKVEAIAIGTDVQARLFTLAPADVRATVALNSDICVHHPEIIEEGEKRRWEWMGHNQSNSRRLNEVPAEEEPTIIRDTLDTIASVSGRRPVGGWARDCRRLGTRSISWWRQVANMSQIGVPTTISPTR
jgi:hypothetical protein